MVDLGAQLKVLQKDDLIDQICSLEYYLGHEDPISKIVDTSTAKEMLITTIISYSTVVQRALLQAVTQGHAGPNAKISKEKLENQLVAMGDKEKVIDRMLQREIGPVTTFATNNWDERMELEQKEAEERAEREALLSDEQLGIRKDVGDAFNDFFREGMGAAVLNPAKFDIRHGHEDDIMERERDHGLGSEMVAAGFVTSVDEANRMGEKKKEEWQVELRKLDIEHKAKARVGEFHTANAAMSMTDVMKAGREKAAEKARIARIDERRARQETTKSGGSMEVYTQRQEELMASRAEALKERTHTQIHEYARTGNIEMLNADPVLLASMIELPGMFGDTPLVCAMSEGQTGAAVLLIGCKANIDVKDDDGMTPLMWACASKQPRSVEALLKAGALVTLTDNAGNTAMDWTASNDLQGADVAEKRESMKNENKRRWGIGGKVTQVIERTGADWKSGWAAPNGDNWSLTTWLGPAQGIKISMDPDKSAANSRRSINKATGMLKHADFTTYRVAKPDFKEFPAFGHDSVQVIPSQDIVGRKWDRLNRYDGMLKETKVYEAVMRGEQMEDVLHDIAWHDMVGTLLEGGSAMGAVFVETLTHCVETLGYALSVAMLHYEREAMRVLRDRLRDLVRLFSGGAAARACEFISMLPEKDEDVPEIAPTALDNIELGMDRTARTRRKLTAAEQAPGALSVGEMEARAKALVVAEKESEAAAAAERKAQWEALQSEYSAAGDLPALQDGVADPQPELPALEDGRPASPASPKSAGGSRPSSRQSAAGSRPNSRQSGGMGSRPNSRQSGSRPGSRQSATTATSVSSAESNRGQLTLRIFAHLLVTANDIPGREACNANSQLAQDNAHHNRQSGEAQEKLKKAKDKLEAAGIKRGKAASVAALATEEMNVAEQKNTGAEGVVNGLLKQLDEYHAAFTSPPKDLQDELNVVNMTAIQCRIEYKIKRNESVDANEVYKAASEAHDLAEKELKDMEDHTESTIADAHQNNLERVAAARAEWRQEWKALDDVDECYEECRRLGLETVESDGKDILHDRLANYTASSLALALVERLEVMLIDLYDTDGLRAFLTRQIGPDLFRQVYTNLREVDRALYVRGIHADTTEGFLKSKFDFFGRIEHMRMLPRFGGDGSKLRSECVIIFEDADGAATANAKGSLIVQDVGIHFRTYDQEFAEQQVFNAMDAIGKTGAIDRLNHLIKLDIEEAAYAAEMAKPKEQRDREKADREMAAAMAAEKIRLEEQQEREDREAAEQALADAEAKIEYTVKAEIFEMLDSAMGMGIRLSESMEARKAARNEKWGLTDAGTKKKEKPLPSLDTPEGAKLYNLITHCVKSAKKVTPQDLRDTFTEEELVDFLGMQSSAAASNKLELAKWFMPVALRYWDEVCDALAQKGSRKSKADAKAGRTKSVAWKRARGGMVLQNALGKSTPKKELSVRSAAARGDRKSVNRFLHEGVNMNVANALGWTAYHYALHNGYTDVARLLIMSGCDETDPPYLSSAEKLTSKQYRVVQRSMLREEVTVDSAMVGYLEKDEIVHVVKLLVTQGTQRAQVDRGWTTVMGNASVQEDKRTQGAARLVPVEDKTADTLARGF